MTFIFKKNGWNLKTDLQKSNLFFEIQRLYKIYFFHIQYVYIPEKSLKFNNLPLKFKKIKFKF